MEARDILFNDHFQNFKRYQIPKAQLIIADMPYNLGINAYASNPSWYTDGDNKNGESSLAGTEFFDTDKDFRPAEFMHFCSQMMKKKPKEKSDAPCMIVFCEYEQQFYLIELARRYGIMNYINLVFRKNFSAQVLKANMKVVGNCEYGLLLYRNKLPKFRNEGKMVFNCIDWEKDQDSEKIHPTQKPVKLYEWILTKYAKPTDVILDTHVGSASSLIACENTGNSYVGCELDKDYYEASLKRLTNHCKQGKLFT